ncbi:tRNA ligase 1 [Glycine max]|nr:tRNA ligase 1 [Glycine max]
MSAPQRFLCTLSHAPPLYSSISTFKSRTFLFLPFVHSYRTLTPSLSPMPRNQRSGAHVERKWKQKAKTEGHLSAMADAAETVTNKLSGLSIGENSGKTVAQGSIATWKPKSYGTASGGTVTEVENGAGVDASVASTQKSSGSGLSKIFRGDLLENFTVDNSTYSRAQVRATFYPKFENEKSDQEVRTRMIELVAKGLATLEVSLKHSGSLFMYAGHEGGAYAKNSFGNIYTAVGVFVLGRMFREAWGTEASKKQAEFNNFLERNHMCISMELVTAVLGDHGQRPQEDYAVVTAVTELGNGKPKFYSTPEIIAFCRKWRLPTNHVWLFSTRKSAASFFAAYDALCEEGTATSVCKALDEIADISVPGSKDHVKAQGEILEGLVARLVSHDSSNHIEKTLKEFPPPPADGALLESVGSSFCPAYSDWFGTDGADYHSRNADRSVLSKFLQAHPADYSTKKLQEIVRLMREKRFPAAFKCYHNFHKVDAMSSDNIFYKMANKETAGEVSKNSVNETGNSSSGKDDFADEDANLMVKLKFLTYKLRTFLIRNGLSILFKEGPGAYKAYYLRAVYIRRKCGNKPLSSSTYLSEAEPFLEQFAKRSPQNQALIGSAGNLVRTEDFLAIVEGGQDEEGDLVAEREIALPGPNISVKDTVPKYEGLIVFFPGIPGCAKSALCKELLNDQGGLGDDRPVHSLMGDLIKGKYWQKVAEERRKKPNSIMLADKNAPNEEVWRLIEDMCHKTRASAVPVVAESEGTDSNPFSLDALAVFMFRVLQRVNHPGNLDKGSPNAGYVLLMFYHLYEGRNRREFEGELIERFGSLVKMPLLKSDRNPLPEPVQSVLEEGIDLYKLHTKRHGRLESTKGSYAKEWIKWEKQLRDILCGNAEYFNSIQVPFEFAVKQVLEQLRSIAKGEYTPPDTERRKFGTIVFAALSMPVTEIHGVLNKLAQSNPKINEFLKDKRLENVNRAHLTLAHKRSHGIKAVADYGIYHNKKVPVELTALLFTDKMAAFEACTGSVEGEKIVSKNSWPHITLWTAEGVAAKDANMLPQLLAEGKANRIDFNPPINISGTLDFY